MRRSLSPAAGGTLLMLFAGGLFLYERKSEGISDSGNPPVKVITGNLSAGKARHDFDELRMDKAPVGRLPSKSDRAATSQVRTLGNRAPDAEAGSPEGDAVAPVSGLSPRTLNRKHGTDPALLALRSQPGSWHMLRAAEVEAAVRRIPLAYRLDEASVPSGFAGASMEAVNSIIRDFEDAISTPARLDDPSYGVRWSQALPTAEDRLRTLYGWTANANLQREAAIERISGE